ncbi:MAG: lysophospholipase [Actinomycetia bacterium]|nr:lysophospholipase [Actinomycetes bacterium]
MDVRVPPWTWRALALVGGFFLLVVFGLSWLHANAIREEFLLPRLAQTDYPLQVISNEAGRIIVTRTPASEREGLWGFETESAYAQVSTIVRIDQETVERGTRTLDGEIKEADAARMNADAYTGDPLTAHGLGFEEDLAIPSDIGPHGTWFIDGRRSTWVIFVHGRGIDRLGESLRIIPSLVEQGYPIVSMRYRGDDHATPNPSGMRLWGLDEWKDVEAAVDVAQRKGARDVVLIGSGYGASIVSTFLHESDAIAGVRAVIYDSPVIDLEGVVERWAAEGSTPGPIAWLGRRLTTVRFGMEWALLDQSERVAEFDVPMLLLIGGEDPVTPIDELVGFGSALGDLATVERFEQGGSADLWNIDSARYERAVERFLFTVVGPE